MKKHIGLYVIITLLVSLTAAAFSLGVSAQADTATLELTVYQVAVIDEVAAITGPAAGVEVELYDILGEELIASDTVGSDGKVSFTLDDRYPLSGRGVYHTVAKVDGTSNGEITCEQGQTCPVAAFSVEGFDPDSSDAILIVKVVRSDDLVTPVAGVQINAWPKDNNGIPLQLPIIGLAGAKDWDYSGVACISNPDGLCVMYLKKYFNWVEDNDHLLMARLILKFGNLFTYDGSSLSVTDDAVHMGSIAVDENNKLDDCIFKPAPGNTQLNPSCMDKVHQTATAQATITVNPEIQKNINNVVIQTYKLTKDTIDIFASHNPDQSKIAEFLNKADQGTFSTDLQVKIILQVVKINNDGVLAFFDGPAIGTTVEITSPENPDILLGACTVNSLGECISIIDRSILLAQDGFVKFRVLADDYDNGILICSDAPICEQRVYTVVNLTGKKDAIFLYKFVREDNLMEPVANVTANVLRGTLNKHDFEGEGCQSDEYGACPIYALDPGMESADGSVWTQVNINGNSGYDTDWGGPQDDHLGIFKIAISRSGSVVDCTFFSPLNITLSKYANPSCFKIKRALQTAVAGYTATPTVTITPTLTSTPTSTITTLPSSTATATEIPTATPKPGLFTAESTPLAIGGIALLVILLGGGNWWILRVRRGRNKRS
jgi:hypothetical protein